VLHIPAIRLLCYERYCACCAACCACCLQVDGSVEQQVLDHRLLSGHANIIQLKEVGSGWGAP